MSLSTSSSNTLASSKSLTSSKTLGLALLLALIILGGIEMYWREAGLEASINPSADKALWAFQRTRVNDDPDALAIVGTSRALYDLHQKTLAQETGYTHVGQLAIAGSHPLATLEDLADDPHFKGRIICELTEQALSTVPWESQRPYTNRRGEHFTLPERWGSVVRAKIEEHVVLLSPAAATLNRVKWAALHQALGATEWRIHWTADRTTACVPGHLPRKEWFAFVTDQELAAARQDLAVSFESRLSRLKGIVQRLHARGVPVIFIRAPVTPDMEALYEKHLPRSDYWNRMVSEIDAPFVRADDYPQLSLFSPPDGSHLCGEDPRLYTERLSAILKSKDLFRRAHPL
jgi:hypothetical protein